MFLYLAFIRTRGISETFWLLGDQILYWKIALRPASELPIGGGPSSVGGTTLGPVFCWVLWGIRHLVGPWTDNLPHAGGIGLSLIQSLADAMLFAAIWRATSSALLAFAVIVFVATGPYDMALTATIWNPPLAEAFVKMSAAFVLWGSTSPWATGAATAFGLLAVQAHSSAVFFAVPAVASLIAREMLAHGWKTAARQVVVVALVILALEMPYLYELRSHPSTDRSPAAVVENVVYTLTHPSTLRVTDSAVAVRNAAVRVLLEPWTFAWFGTLLAAACVVTIIRARKTPGMLGVTVGPLVCAVLGFSLWQGVFDHYWFLVIMPSVALTIGFALTAWKPAAPAMAAALAFAVALAQPARQQTAMTIHRLPQYAPLVKGSREIKRQANEVFAIETDLTLPPSTDLYFLYQVLGGALSPRSDLIARIDADGGVVLRKHGP